MKILVCISKVPDTTAKIAFQNNDSEFTSEGVQFIMNPTDEWYALVRGLELKESLGGTVTVVHVGRQDSDQIVRKALAIGADDAVRIDADPLDAYYVAAQIAAYANDKSYDLILTGKETIDYNGFQIGGMLAEVMDLPFVSLVSNLEIDGSNALMMREIEGGIEKVSCTLPVVLSSQKGMAEQRIPNMRGIMMARSKPLEVIAPDTSIEALTEIAVYELPPARSEVKLVSPDNVEELVELLSKEAKAI